MQGSLLIMNQQRPTPQVSPRAPAEAAEVPPSLRGSPGGSPRGSVIEAPSSVTLKRSSIGPSRLAR